MLVSHLAKLSHGKQGPILEKDREVEHVERIMALISKVQCEHSDFFFFMVGNDFLICFIRSSTKVMSSLDWFHCLGLS